MTIIPTARLNEEVHAVHVLSLERFVPQFDSTDGCIQFGMPLDVCGKADGAGCRSRVAPKNDVLFKHLS